MKCARVEQWAVISFSGLPHCRGAGVYLVNQIRFSSPLSSVGDTINSKGHVGNAPACGRSLMLPPTLYRGANSNFVPQWEGLGTEGQ